MASMALAFVFSTMLRFVLSVGVSSSVSTEKSRGRMVKRWILEALDMYIGVKAASYEAKALGVQLAAKKMPSAFNLFMKTEVPRVKVPATHSTWIRLI